MKCYVADFETTTLEDDCHVWAYAVTEIGNSDDVMIGTSIYEFMEWCENQKENNLIYFHNLKFDGQFLIYWLLDNGFTHANNSDERASNTFTTLISNKGLYYAIEVIFYLNGRNVRKVVFQDSYKLIPLSVEEIAKSFKLPYKKGIIDYDAHNNLPIGSPLTSEEEEYIKNDVRIVADAIAYFYSQGLNRMTIGSCALSEYKNIVSKKNFKRWFPPPSYDADIRQAYRGGFTCVNRDYENKTVGNGVVLDINSMYPYVMRKNYLPYGTPIFYWGEYQQDEMYPLYIQMLQCSFELKPGKIPIIQSRTNQFYRGSEYLTSSEDEEIVICLNSVDLELFFEHYDVYNPVFLSGWKFKATKGLFDEFIDKWSTIKIESRKNENWGMYTIAKLMLNSLYGKFGVSLTFKSRIPYLNEKTNKVEYYDSDPKAKDPVYLPVASFVTSYARQEIITASQKIMDNYNNGISKAQWIYSDTDSCHVILNGEDEETFIRNSGLDIDDSRLGAYKFEGRFTKAKYIRQKCYIQNFTDDVNSEDPEYKMKVVVAGMPHECHSQVTFKNFKIGATYTGKKQPRMVTGGCILESVEFTIKE